MLPKRLQTIFVIPLLLAAVLATSPVFGQDEAPTDAPGEAASTSFSDTVDAAFGSVNEVLAGALFFTVPLKTIEVPVSEEAPDGTQAVGMPFIVALLGLGGLFFTVRYGFVNIRLFAHAIQVVQGKFDAPDHEGEISHFQALTSALSATVGLGNIAGVAAAIALGGPGAVFWMWIIAFLGMSMKFSSCTFAQLYRRFDKDGKTLGGPMVYLEEGLTPILSFPVAKFFGVFYAVLCILASFGGGNLFQGNQTAAALIHTFGFERSDVASAVVGLSLAILAGIVIIGGIRRIGEVTSKIVPAMCVFYVGVCIFTIVTNIGQAGQLFASIFTEAFTGDALGGGAAGGLILVFATGAQRAVFSNEAGVGSAAIAHSAAKTDEPIREGVVAMIGPFIDTIVICTMTALTLLITDVFGGSFGQSIGFSDGAIRTIEAFVFDPRCPWPLLHRSPDAEVRSLWSDLCFRVFDNHFVELLRRPSRRVSVWSSRRLALSHRICHPRCPWPLLQPG